eukprot:554805-Rhodomonas_salina.2
MVWRRGVCQLGADGWLCVEKDEVDVEGARGGSVASEKGRVRTFVGGDGARCVLRNGIGSLGTGEVSARLLSLSSTLSLSLSLCLCLCPVVSVWLSVCVSLFPLFPLFPLVSE